MKLMGFLQKTDKGKLMPHSQSGAYFFVTVRFRGKVIDNIDTIASDLN